MNVKRILGCALLGGMMVVTAACGNNSADKTITPVAQAETVNIMALHSIVLSMDL